MNAIIPCNNDRTASLVQNESGAALIISLMFLAIASLLGSTAVLLTSTDMQIGSNYKSSSVAFYNADAGVNYAIAKMEEGMKANPPTFPSGTTLDDMNIGDITAFPYSVPSGFSFFISGIEKFGVDTYSFTSTGTGPNNSTTILHVKVRPKKPSLFNYGIFGDESVRLRGQGYSDSYNSKNGPWVSEGQYTEGDVGTNSTAAGAITVSGANAKVYGEAQIGPGGDTNIGISTHSIDQVSGRSVADEPKDMTCMTDPGGGAANTLVLTSHDTKSFSSGSYRLPSINISSHGECIITGNVTFYVIGNISITGQGRLTIQPGGSLKIYVSGNVNPLAGQGVANQTGYPENLQIYGMATCTTVNISGQNALCGAIYTPEADINLSGQGDVFGAICGNTIDIVGQGSVHYDEALNDIKAGTANGFERVSWVQR